MSQARKDEKYSNINDTTQSISNVIQLIKFKKAQITKKLEQMNATITHNTKSNEFQVQQTLIASRKVQKNYYLNQSQKEIIIDENSPQGVKYKTILEKTLDEVAFKPKTTMDYKIRKYNRLPNRQISNSIHREPFKIDKKQKNRTMTEVQDLESRKINNKISPNTLNKLKGNESRTNVIEKAKIMFVDAIQKIPKVAKNRNEQNLSQTIDLLEAFNPFFCRIQRIVSCCLIKMGKIRFQDQSSILYKCGQAAEHVFIILMGKIKISNGKSVKKICETGQTILQEMIFSDKSQKMSLQRAKVLEPTFLLQIKGENYKKIKEELIKFGFKLGFNEMEAIIKRNYIIKNWMRNKQNLQGRSVF